MTKQFSIIALATTLASLFFSCAEDPVPKPKGWLRLDLPPQRFVIQEEAPFSVERPVYSVLVERPTRDSSRWYDLRFKDQRATVHMTWSAVHGDLPELIEDAHAFKQQHEAKAASIRSERVLRDSARVFGTFFDVEGEVASPLVFYLTDSTDNFLYGSLYFEARPNADSLAPVTERLREDVRYFAATLRWRAVARFDARP
ncbi:MAG: hypothetical protein IPL52_17015 [Flavobacteriales bacterium]|nr:hypothetical protein [Flavobacteriales bacterium]